MTDRLYYRESYLTDFDARVIEAGAGHSRVYLDRTAFYPTSGGQPFDLGTIGGIPVTDVIDEEDRIVHVLAAPLRASEVACQIDWPRRFDHMQQHTGQHLLSAVFLELLSAQTVSFHMGVDSATIDVTCPALHEEQMCTVEQRANGLVFENRPVTISFEDPSHDLGLRKPSGRAGQLRIVSIQGLDRSACGGTHVNTTGEIGPILLRKIDRVRGNMRVEFLCGMRSVKRARADYAALAKIARSFSAALDDTPPLVTAQLEKAQEAEKARRRLTAELADAKGVRLYAQTAPDASGLRKIARRVKAISEDLRIEAQSFAAGERAVILLLGEEPPSVLLAASKDSGWKAGEWLKPLLAEAGGRGGGTAIIAQGSLPSVAALDGILKKF